MFFLGSNFVLNPNIHTILFLCIKRSIPPYSRLLPRLENNNTYLKVCVECHSTHIKNDKEACEVYCQTCGLVHQASIDYANGNKINLPWGLYK